MSSALRLKGPLDSDQLQKALNRIVTRHESLRTCFLKNHKGEAYQKILPPTPVNIPLHDLSEESDSELILQQRIESTKSTPVSLALPPLQLELYRLAKEDHVLVLLDASHCLRSLVGHGFLAGVNSFLQVFQRNSSLAGTSNPISGLGSGNATA